MKIIAHRGASLEAPENTLAAFKRAINKKADWIELDVRLTKDQVPIVFHDHFIEDQGDLYDVESLTYEEVIAFDIGERFLTEFAGEKIPTLKEALGLSANFMIEIKDKAVEIIVKVIQESDIRNQVVVGSISPQVLAKVQKQDSELKRVGIVERGDQFKEFIEQKPALLAVRFQLLNEETVRELHDKGFEIWAWTVDDPYFAEELNAWGVDGVITNNVSRFVDWNFK